MNLSALYEEIGDYDQCEAMIFKAKAVDENHYMVLFNEGVLYMRRNEPLNAIAAFDKVIDMVPDYGYAYLNKGIVLRDIGQVDESIEVFNHGLYECSDAIYLLYNRACCHLQKQDISSCTKDLIEVLRRRPDMADYMSKDDEVKEVIATSEALQSLIGDLSQR